MKVVSPSKKKKPKTKAVSVKRGVTLTKQDLETIFKFWCITRSQKATASKFNLTASRVGTLCTKHKWIERYENKVLPQIQRATNKEVARKLATNLDVVRGLKFEAVENLKDRLLTGNIEVTIKDVTDLIKLEVILTNDTPIEVDTENRGHALTIIQQNVYMTVEEVKEESERITSRLRKLSEKNLIGNSVRPISATDNGGESLPEHVRGTDIIKSG